MDDNTSPSTFMADIDVEMEGAAGAGPVLAEDNAHTWAKVSDLALRHMARVNKPAPHPEDASVQEAFVTWNRTEFPIQHPLANRDAHIPASVRVPKTSSLVDTDMRRVCARFARRPSDFYAAGSDVWTCPKDDCVYTIVLDDLSPDERDLLEAATRGAEGSFMTFVDGATVASRACVRQVIDILGLEHYEVAHLQGQHMRHVIHGQNYHGHILYYWEPTRIDKEFIKKTVRGWEARRYEERCRLDVQRALAGEARKWANWLITVAQKGDRDARQRSRSGDSRYIRENYEHIVALGRPDGLFDVRAYLFEGRPAGSSAIRGTISAMEHVHLQYFEGYRTREEESAKRDKLRAVAATEKEYWATGAGAGRLIRRENLREMYL